MPVFLLALAAGFLDFLHITDTHVIRMDKIHPEIAAARAMYTSSVKELEKFAGSHSQTGAKFIVHTGDMIDAWCFDTAQAGVPVHGQMELFLSAVKPVAVPLYPVLGNHDVECYRTNPKDAKKPVGDQTVGDQTRAAWKRALPGFKRGTYYSFAKKVGGTRYRIAVLDNGQAIPPGSPEFLDRQMGWLSRELKRHPKDKFILALHIPIGSTPFSQALRKAVGASPNVVMILCGHNHTDNISKIELGASRPTQVRTSAMFKGADQWRRIRLHKDRIEVSATSKPDEIVTSIDIGR